MTRPIRITRIVVTRYQYPIADRAMDPVKRLDMLYQPGGTVSSGGRMSPGGDGILTIETDAGIAGQVPGSIDAAAAHYLLGRDALARDTVWHDLKRFYRGKLNAPPGAIDAALGDSGGSACD